MGLGIFRWKILLIAISVLLLWQSSKVWLNLTQEKYGIEGKNPYVYEQMSCKME